MAARSKMRKWAPWAAGALGLAWLLRRGGDDDGGLEGGEGAVVGPQPRRGEDTTTVGRKPKPGVHRDQVVEQDIPSRAGPPPEIRKTRVVYATAGAPASVELDVPLGPYQITVRAMLPDIGYAIKLGGKEYGIGQGPSGSTPVLSAIAKAVNVAGKLAPMVAGDAYSAAITTAIKAITAIANAIPDLVKRARVKAWAKFCAGKKGSKSTRKKIKAAIKKWYNPDRIISAPYGERRGYWRYEGNAAGDWPMVSGEQPPSGTPGSKPIPPGEAITSASPSIVATELVGQYLRIRFESADAAYTGQIRYDITVFTP